MGRYKRSDERHKDQHRDKHDADRPLAPPQDTNQGPVGHPIDVLTRGSSMMATTSAATLMST